MTPKEKAEQLVIKFLKLTSKHKGLETAGQGAIHLAKQCALICCDEVLGYMGADRGTEFWIEVKQEIEKL